MIAQIVIEQRTDPIDLILCLSNEGKMSRILNKYKLPIPLVSACPDSKIIKQLNLMNGIVPIKVPRFDSKILGPDHLIKILLKTYKDVLNCEIGNYIIVVRSENEGTEHESHNFTFIRNTSELQ
jgi:pyruvate kinase